MARPRFSGPRKTERKTREQVENARRVLLGSSLTRDELDPHSLPDDAAYEFDELTQESVAEQDALRVLAGHARDVQRNRSRQSARRQSFERMLNQLAFEQNRPLSDEERQGILRRLFGSR